MYIGQGPFSHMFETMVVKKIVKHHYDGWVCIMLY